METVRRALSALRVVADYGDQGVALSSIAAQVGIPPSSAHRLLTELQHEALLSRSPRNLRFFLGPAASSLASERTWRPLNVPHRSVAAAAARTGEPVVVTELFGDSVVCTSLVAPPGGPTPVVFARIGQTMPPHASASARMLLAELPEWEVERWLWQRPLTRFTDRTPVTPDAAMELIRKARERGYDTSDGELESGVWAAAVPLRTSTGRVCAALEVAARKPGSAERVRRTELLMELQRTAREISAGFGWSV